MGKCCSTVPPEHSYEPMNIEEAQKNITPFNNNYNDSNNTKEEVEVDSDSVNIAVYDDYNDTNNSKQEVDAINYGVYDVIDKKKEENEIKLRRHSVETSMKIINKYDGNNNIRNLRRIYMKEYKENMIKYPSKIKKIKSTHSVAKSKKIIAKHKNDEISILKKKYKKIEKYDNINHEDDDKDDDKEDDKEIFLKFDGIKLKRNKSTHSVRRSSKIINEYKGNNDISILKKKYMRMYEENMKDMFSDRIIPPKPKNIEDFMNKRTNIWHKELCEYITDHTMYIGMAEFRDNKELCIEIEFTSNNNGYIEGKRTLINNENNKINVIEINGNGKIYKDVIWNNNKNEYEGCIKFKWMDKNNGIITKLLFNTNTNDLDIDHLYFEGICYQYPSDLNLNNTDIENIDNKNINKGVFNMVCISMRKRHFFKRNGLLNYHKIDIWNMNDDQLREIPKYVKCINITPVKMYQRFQQKSSKNK